MSPGEKLAERMESIDDRLAALEEALDDDGIALDAVLPEAMATVRELLRAYAEREDKAMPESDDLLELQKAFVKGEPSLNAVRDNVRELVYYYNCIDMDRRDALPEAAPRTAVRTARHIYLYLRSRAEQAGYLS